LRILTKKADSSDLINSLTSKNLKTVALSLDSSWIKAMGY